MTSRPAAPPEPGLTAGLSRAFVAVVVGLDNEFEHRMPHRTTRGGGRGPWLVSWVMWQNCLRPLADADGLTAAELSRRVGTRTNVDGMRRWGYVTVADDGALHLTRAGRRAAEVWQELAPPDEPFALLRAALLGFDEALEIGLPDCLPILGHGLFCRGRVSVGEPRPDRDRALPALLSRALLALAPAYEGRSGPVSLAVGANVLGLLPGLVRELPARSGVSKEAVAMALAHLERSGLVLVGAGRARVASLTPDGSRAQAEHAARLAAVEAGWRSRFGSGVDEALVRAEISGPEPYADGWRAAAASVLPEFPMVLHRGGFPDGA